MLNKIKTSLRISHNLLDTDIQRHIDACLLDLKRVGIDTDTPDALVESAVELYVKWAYDFDGKGEQYLKNYAALRNSMSMSEDYMEET